MHFPGKNDFKNFMFEFEFYFLRVYLAPEDPTVVPIVPLCQHVYPQVSDLAVLAVTRALGLTKVPGNNQVHETN